MNTTTATATRELKMLRKSVTADVETVHMLINSFAVRE